ncbi:hypothetical protein V3391_16570 [Luteimonas sp. SMYT11W]|uniref:Tetratricopeptide repeat protein n=1 Tax=Luteimonas flava TaxID=3115822 RepID=A0ABU7WIN2_9GAMM
MSVTAPVLPHSLPLGRHLATACFLVVATLTCVAYWPGVAGDFLFDDFANLPALGRYGGVRDVESLVWFLTSGIADPTGRPVSMASFLLDARDWPADAYAFKRTNIFLHAVNGLALFWMLCALLERTTRDRSRARWTAFIAAAIWISHPLWTSTVLYVVQRQAMLAALFCLLGLRAWIGALNAFDADRRCAGWCLAVLAIPVAGLLAGLSKANGFLLPLLVASLQWTLLGAAPATGAQGHRRTVILLLVAVPSLLIVSYITYASIAAAPGVEAMRGWSTSQRLLSEPRALAEYVSALWVPGLDARGIFADDFVVSRDLRTPNTTLPALLALAAAVVAMVVLRKRLPSVAAAIAFFLAGHLMESSGLPLELYFEHRNYLPAILLFLPLAMYLTAQRRYRLYITAGTGVLLLLLLALTFAQARLWGDTGALSRAWATAMPDSARAQNFAALVELDTGRADLAEARLVRASSRLPSEIQLAISLFKARCALWKAPSARQVEALLPRQGILFDVSYNWLLEVMRTPPGDECSLDVVTRKRLLAAAISKPTASAEEQGRMSNLRAHDALSRLECPAALAAFRRRLEIQPRPEFALTDTGLLATVCGPGSGLSLLNAYLEAGTPIAPAASPILRLRDSLMQRNDYWGRELETLRRTLVYESAP